MLPLTKEDRKKATQSRVAYFYLSSMYSKCESSIKNTRRSQVDPTF